MVSSGSSAPVIGLTTYVETATWGAWDRPAALLPRAYVDGVGAAGALPVLLPPSPGAAADALSVVDGLVVTGGPDLDPAHYGARPHPLTGAPRPDRDGWEMALCRAALDRDIPLLAVCRGIQVLNAVCGGTLHQHLPEIVGHDGHRPAPGAFGRTKVDVRPGTLTASVLGTEVSVFCSHHQGIDRLGAGLVATGFSEDGTIEGIEAPNRRFAVGVQWHPEEDGSDLRLFEALAKAAGSTWYGDRSA